MLPADPAALAIAAFGALIGFAFGVQVRLEVDLDAARKEMAAELERRLRRPWWSLPD